MSDEKQIRLKALDQIQQVKIVRAIHKRAIRDRDASLMKFTTEILASDDPMALDLEELRQHWQPPIIVV